MRTFEETADAADVTGLPKMTVFDFKGRVSGSAADGTSGEGTSDCRGRKGPGGNWNWL